MFEKKKQQHMMQQLNDHQQTYFNFTGLMFPKTKRNLHSVKLIFLIERRRKWTSQRKWEINTALTSRTYSKHNRQFSNHNPNKTCCEFLKEWIDVLKLQNKRVR